MSRKPLALANWKMDMTVAESLAFVQDFLALAGDCLDSVDVILCPPYTALGPLAEKLDAIYPQPDEQDTPITVPDAESAPRVPIQLGAQNVASSTDPARTGQISAALLADVGCECVMLGHWEVRRHLGDDDDLVNRKVHLALEAGLRPIPFMGEARGESVSLVEALEGHLERVLDGCTAEQVACMTFVYEPEGAIGTNAPISSEHVAAACTCIRSWLRREWGKTAADRVQVVYGGSVAPEFAPDLLKCSDLDGLAATRRGRDPATFGQIVRLMADARGGGDSA
jgi:triosephosphate isomerase